jgi:ribosomal protein L37E
MTPALGLPMDEAQWFSSTDPAAMLAWLAGEPKQAGDGPRISDRRLRLFACACCRQVWHLLTDPRSRRAVEVAERYADGDATEAERVAAADTANFDAPPTCFTCYVDPVDGLDHIARLPAANPALQAALLRDLVGNPWRPLSGGRHVRDERVCETCGHRYDRHPGKCTVCGSDYIRKWRVRDTWGWLTPAAVSVAQAAYQERDLPSGRLDPARLAVLADALEEAGCEDEQVLGHLRGLGPHVRGCWSLDVILGKG